jgi:hypothetical protein
LATYAYGFSVRQFGNPGINTPLTAPPGLSQFAHALHRLLAPRHPPHALSSLAAFILPSAVFPPRRGIKPSHRPVPPLTRVLGPEPESNDPILSKGSAETHEKTAAPDGSRRRTCILVRCNSYRYRIVKELSPGVRPQRGPHPQRIESVQQSI